MSRKRRATTYRNAAIVAKPEPRFPPGLPKLACKFLAVIVVYAIAYFACSKLKWGHVGAETAELDFLTSVYFSVVTITTLGYGDVSPSGLARPLACTEVLLGLVFAGFLIDTVTGWRAAYQLRVLFQGRLDDEVKSYRNELKRLLKEGRLIATKAEEGVASISELERLFGPIADPEQGVFDELAAIVRGYARRLRYAAQDFPYYDETPVRSIARLLGDIRDCLELANQSALPRLSGDPSTPTIDYKRLRQRVWQLAESASAIATSAKKDTSVADFHHLSDVMLQRVAVLKSDKLVNAHGRER